MLLQVVLNGQKMLFRKPPDFTHNEFSGKFAFKSMEICSQNEITFSLTS